MSEECSKCGLYYKEFMNIQNEYQTKRVNLLSRYEEYLTGRPIENRIEALDLFVRILVDNPIATTRTYKEGGALVVEINAFTPLPEDLMEVKLAELFPGKPVEKYAPKKLDVYYIYGYRIIL